jgi:hypothetical protein
MVVDGCEPPPETQLDQLAKQAAELALLLAGLSARGLRNDPQALDAVEELALRLLKEVSAVRTGKNRAVGETSGIWRAMQPLDRR